MRNRVFWGLLVGVAVIVAVLLWAALSSPSGSATSNPIGTVFTIVFLAVAVLAWEFLMKPGYGRRVFRREDEAELDSTADEEPRSRGPT